MAPSFSTVAAVGVAVLCGSHARATSQLRAPGASLARDADNQLAKPFSFSQRLVICNAYPSASPMTSKLNGADFAGDAGRSIAFQECRVVGDSVNAGDRIDVTMGDAMKSTFEVGTLPPADAELLLIPYKRKGSSMIHFQSFAFPDRADGKDAQMALFDTFAGIPASPKLRMEEHPMQEGVASKGSESLAFDRVYSVEGGVYDVKVDDAQPVDSLSLLEEPLPSAAKEVYLQKDQNYVVIRTGDELGEFPMSLIVYPQSPLPPYQRKVVVPKPTVAPAKSEGILAWFFSR